MRQLTAGTIIRVRNPLPLPRKRELTGETRIRLSQIVDLLTWRLTRDKKDRNGKEHSDKNGHFVKQKGDSKTKANAKKARKTAHRSLPPVTIEKTQTVVKRDATGKVIDSNWEIKAGATIDHAELIAEGNDIKDVKRLVREYPGTKPEEWTKEKGVGIIEPKKGAKKRNGKPLTKARHSELHWYKSQETGEVEIKRTKWMD